MKKTVNILMMEPKQLLFNLTKKAIESKPDEEYSIQIVRSALTAKAGYFELYKQKPHILLLNPELTDEDGESFIQHALERLPNLKVVVMTSKLQNHDLYLQSGASAIVSVPLQRASLWRILDEVVEELDTSGLLNQTDQTKEDPVTSTPQENLFQLDESEDTVEFTPIFDDVTNHTAKEPEVEPEVELVNPVVDPMIKEFEDVVVIDDSGSVVEFENLSFEEQVIPTTDGPTSESIVEDNDIVVDGFAEFSFDVEPDNEPIVDDSDASEYEPNPKDGHNEDSFQPLEFDPFEETNEPNQEITENSNPDDVEDSYEPPIFDPYSFDEPELTGSTLQNNSDTPLFDLGSTSTFKTDKSEDSSDHEEALDDDSSFSFFKFDAEDDDKTSQAQQEEVKQVVELEPSQTTEEVDVPLFSFDSDPQTAEFKRENTSDGISLSDEKPKHIENSPPVEDAAAPLSEFVFEAGESTRMEEETLKSVEKEIAPVKQFRTRNSSFAKQKSNRLNKRFNKPKKKESLKVEETTVEKIEDVVAPIIEPVTKSNFEAEMKRNGGFSFSPTPFEESHVEKEVYEVNAIKVETSNQPQTENQLYLQPNEYNKPPAKRGHSFEQGFFNKEGHFVSLYPPRESFSYVTGEAVLNETEITENKSNKSNNIPEDKGVLSSVKKLFRRR